VPGVTLPARCHVSHVFPPCSWLGSLQAWQNPWDLLITFSAVFPQSIEKFSTHHGQILLQNRNELLAKVYAKFKNPKHTKYKHQHLSLIQQCKIILSSFYQCSYHLQLSWSVTSHIQRHMDHSYTWHSMALVNSCRELA
jgi:hypothetical protein